MIRWVAYLLALLVAATFHLQQATDLAPAEQWSLAPGRPDATFEEALFVYAALPRLAVALLVGAALGLAGSLLQQVTQNRLVSPLTVGAASGAWLALLVASVLAPAVAATHGVWFSMAGAIAATALALAIAGPGGLGGLQLVLAGMAVHILLGAVATLTVLLNEMYVRNLFIWGAGDLTQTGWDWVPWLAPQIAAAFVAAMLCHRPLTLMRLGASGAGARGLAVWPFMLVAVLLALWMTASAITAVGLIGFIGLLAPNIARLTGARTTRDELLASAAVGATVLVATDGLAVIASEYSRDMVPSGAGAALIGAPALIWLGLRRLRSDDHGSFRAPSGATRLGARAIAAAALLCVAAPLVALVAGPDSQGWSVAWPSAIVWDLRWPRVLAAMGAGAGMAVAGVILQRLLHNPLASPDIVGVSSGATLAVVASVILFDASVHEGGGIMALLGCLGVLALLLALGRRHSNAPAVMALAGIAIAALLDAMRQFVLARGDDDAFQLLGWLAGSTYRVSPDDALTLVALVGFATLAALALHRWLTLLGIGDAAAAGRGLSPHRARSLLLVVVGVAVASVTAAVGPIAFVGLVAPHVASMLGAARPRAQILMAAGVGLALLVLSDWVGRTVFYPLQLPSGEVAAILGGTYFALLLSFRRRL